MLDFKISLNIKEIERYLDKIGDKISSELRVAKKDIGKMVVKTSAKYSPELKGDLKRSIKYKAKRNQIDIFVRRQSKAGKYAYIRHYDKYKYGKKTLSKANAGRLFIQRAIEDNEKNIQKRLEKVLTRAKNI